MLCSTCTSGTCYDKTLPSVLLCMRCQIVPRHPVYVMLVPMLTTGCLACAKTPEVYASVRRLHSLLPECVSMMPRQELGWPVEATLVYVLCRGPTSAGPPSPCFASFEGVAPAVLPILYSTIGGSPRSHVQGNPGLLTAVVASEGFLFFLVRTLSSIIIIA